MPLPNCLTRIAFCAALLVYGSALAQEGALRLGPGDTVEVSVLARADYDTRAMIEDGGTLAIRGVGRIAAAGQTSATLEDEVERALRELGVASPVVTLQVVAWRDVGILGDVREPGQVAYHPGMTVMSGLVRAGGFLRGGADGDEDLTLIDARARAERVAGDLRLAEIRRDRLQAQIDGADAPAHDAGDRFAGFQETEAAIAETNAAERARSQEILEQQLAAIDEQIDLRARINATYDDRLSKAREDLERIEDLFEDGLTNADRVSMARERLSSITLDQLENRSAYADAIQDRAEVSLALAAVGSTRTEDLARQLSDAVSDVTRLTSELRLEQDRVLALGGDAGAVLGRADAVYDVSYSISRTVDGVTAVSDAGEGDRLLPGDILTVTRQVKDD